MSLSESVLNPPPPGAVTADAVESTLRDRLAEYVTLSKPRIGTMVLVSAAVGFTLATERGFDVILLSAALLGVGLSAAASSILNQWVECGAGGYTLLIQPSADARSVAQRRRALRRRRTPFPQRSSPAASLKPTAGR